MKWYEVRFETDDFFGVVKAKNAKQAKQKFFDAQPEMHRDSMNARFWHRKSICRGRLTEYGGIKGLTASVVNQRRDYCIVD